MTDEERAMREAYREIMASPADVQGVISKITGNEITLDLIEPIEQYPRIAGGDGDFPEGFDPENLPEWFDPENMPEGFDPGNRSERFDPENMPEWFDPENMPEGEFPSGGMVRGGQSLADQEISVTYTGTSLSVTIPVSLSIMSGRNTINATELSKKLVISLWYGDDGQTIAYAMVQGKAAAEGDAP